MMTHKQLAMIQAAKRQLGLSEADYRNLLLRIGKAASARDLTPAGFTALMWAFETLGFKRTNPPPHVRRGMATPAQLALVNQLWLQYSGSDDQGAMRAWLERSFKISSPRFMTTDHAAMAINALRVMNRRKAFQEAQAKKPSGAA